MNRTLHHAALVTGLAAVAWVGAGYATGHPLALAMTVLIAAFFLLGAVELHRYHQATTALARAVDALDGAAPPAGLATWLEPLPASLRAAVRLRVEGDRVPLPGPALTPFLAGLLVLLGMLGTFLGMVVTLHGTGAALESATDLTAVRQSLVAPVQGLGLAFGTSVAGVAASAALGLMSAVCRRERVAVSQALDARIATTLRPFSGAHQREESLKALQRQADLVPQLVDRLQALMERMTEQAEASAARLQAGQDAFHARTGQAYETLAASVDRTLQRSLTEGARAAAATIQPVVEATMAGIAREATTTQGALAQAVQRQLDQLAEGFERSSARVAETWQASLAAHQQAARAQSAELQAAIAQSVSGLDERSAQWLAQLAERQAQSQAESARAMAALAADTAALQERVAQSAATQLAAVGERLDGSAREVTAGWRDALAGHQQASRALAEDTRQALAGAATDFAARAAALLETVRESQAALQAGAQARDQAHLATFADALARHQQASEQSAAGTQAALAASLAAFEAQAAALAGTVRQAHDDLMAQAATRDEARLAAWSQGLEALAASLRDEWRAAGAQTIAQQQQVCETLSRTAQDITAQAEAHARETIGEIGRLVEAASEAPRAAAEVIGELRQQLSASMARDHEVLEERARLLATIDTLLDGVNRAATEQRGAIDALVGSSADLLARVGGQFGEQMERAGTRFHEDLQAGTARLAEVAAELTGSAVEVASLGESFGVAVQQFGESNAQLMAQLQAIESALSKSMARSDEQLAYYVAQAREVIDLSLMSQKQILDDLQQLAHRGAASPAAKPAPAAPTSSTQPAAADADA